MVNLASPGNRRLPLGIADLLLILVLGLGSARLMLPVVADAFGIAVRSGASDILAVMFLLTVQTLVLFGVLYIVAIRWRGVTWHELGYVAPPAGWLPRTLLMALLSFPLVGAVTWLQQQITGQPFENPQFQVMAPSTFAWRDYIATILVAAFIAPIVEETAFRGLLYRWLIERTRFPIAIAGSALIFSVLHGIPHLIPGIMVLGAILAWMYHRTQSIWVPIVLHGTYNAIVTTALYATIAQGITPPGGST